MELFNTGPPPVHADETAAEADDIASQITAILIKGFKEKEGREPSNEEIQQLIEEMTEERINAMLTGNDDDGSANVIESNTAENKDVVAEEDEQEPLREGHDESNDQREPDEGSASDGKEKRTKNDGTPDETIDSVENVEAPNKRLKVDESDTASAVKGPTAIDLGVTSGSTINMHSI